MRAQICGSVLHARTHSNRTHARACHANKLIKHAHGGCDCVRVCVRVRNWRALDNFYRKLCTASRLACGTLLLSLCRKTKPPACHKPCIITTLHDSPGTTAFRHASRAHTMHMDERKWHVCGGGRLLRCGGGRPQQTHAQPYAYYAVGYFS